MRLSLEWYSHKNTLTCQFRWGHTALWVSKTTIQSDEMLWNHCYVLKCKWCVQHTKMRIFVQTNLLLISERWFKAVKLEDLSVEIQMNAAKKFECLNSLFNSNSWSYWSANISQENKQKYITIRCTESSIVVCMSISTSGSSIHPFSSTI